MKKREISVKSVTKLFAWRESEKVERIERADERRFVKTALVKNINKIFSGIIVIAMIVSVFAGVIYADAGGISENVTDTSTVSKNAKIIFLGKNLSIWPADKTLFGQAVSTLGTGDYRDWLNKTPSSNPPARFAHMIAKVPGTDKVVLFGGYNMTWSFDDTWVYSLSSNNWVEKNPSLHPSDRWNHAMAEIPETDKVLLFGGYNGNDLGDTWVYDLNSNTWVEKTSSPHPSPRSDPAIAGIPETDKILLFGGWRADYCSDTWVYDFGEDKWTEMNPPGHPSARYAHRMAGIPGTDKVVLFGGWTGTPDVGNAWSDTWVYDLGDNTWTNMTLASHPCARFYQGMAAIPETDKILLFGGSDNIYIFGDTWIYDFNNNAWTQEIPSPCPSYRADPAMAGISGKGKVLLFGGAGWDGTWVPLSDTWVYTTGPKATIIGKVTNETAYPLENVDMYLYDGEDYYKVLNFIGDWISDPSTPVPSTYIQSTTTNSNGEYTFTPVPGEYCVLAVPSSGDYSPASSDVRSVAKDETEVINLVLKNPSRYLADLDEAMKFIRDYSTETVESGTEAAAHTYVSANEVIFNPELDVGKKAFNFALDAIQILMAHKKGAEVAAKKALEKLVGEAQTVLYDKVAGQMMLEHWKNVDDWVHEDLERYAIEINNMTWLRNFDYAGSVQDALTYGYEQTGIYQNAMSAIAGGYEAYNSSGGVAYQNPNASFSFSEAKRMLENEAEWLRGEGPVDGVIIAPNGDVFAYKGSQFHNSSYFGLKGQYEAAGTAKNICGVISTAGTGILIFTSWTVVGIPVGGIIVAIGSGGEIASSAYEDTTRSGMVNEFAYTQVYWAADLDDIPEIMNGTVEWLEEEIFSPKLQYIDGEIVNTDIHPDLSIVGKQIVVANVPCPSCWFLPIKTAVKKDNTVEIRSKSSIDNVKTRILCFDRYGNDVSRIVSVHPNATVEPMKLNHDQTATVTLPYYGEYHLLNALDWHFLNTVLWMWGKQPDQKTDVYYIVPSLSWVPGFGAASSSNDNGAFSASASTKQIEMLKKQPMRSSIMAFSTSGSSPMQLGEGVSYFANATQIIDTELSPGNTAVTVNYTTNASITNVTYLMPLIPGSHLNLHVYDETGRHVGHSSVTDTDEVLIPNASYTGNMSNPESIDIADASSKSYTITVEATQFTSSSPVPVVVFAFETPLRPPILGVSPVELYPFMSPGESKNMTVQLAEVGKQKDIEEVTILTHDLMDKYGNILSGVTITPLQNDFNISAGTEIPLTLNINVSGDITLPETPETRYSGNITVNTPNAGEINVSLSLLILDTDIPNVKPISAEQSVTGIHVSCMPLSDINETYKPLGAIPQSAYMVNSTGAGNFSLEFTEIPNADVITAYKIDSLSVPPNQWVELDTTTTANNVTVTMSVWDAPVVFALVPPNASFTYSPTFPTTADTIQFNDTSTDSDGWIEEWYWDFGDGNYSTVQNPAYQYAESGTYWVSLTVTDNDNATNSTSRKLVFSLTDDFNDGNADGWDYTEDYWSVIGGEFVVNAPFGAAPGAWAGQECWSDYAVEADIMHTSLSKQRVDLVGRKTSRGFYAFEFYYHPWFTDRVALLKFDSSGARTIATGSFSFEPNVWYHLKMEFNGSKIKCYVNGTKVIDTTDNSFSHGRTGFYVWNHGGESHLDNVVVTVYNITNLEPTASFTYTPEFPLASDIINFSDLSTDPDGSIVEWYWDFGDDTNETITTPPANTIHQYAATGTYTVTLTVTDNEGATNNVSKDIIIGVTLAEALDNTELNWTTGGDTNWFGQTETYMYDNDSAQNAGMGNLQSTYIQTNITGPGNLTFYWKVSSEVDYDFLQFFIDDVEQANISGEVDWDQMSFDIGSGSHTLKWAYTKDEYMETGSDCGWLDKVVYALSGTLITWGTPNINDWADDGVMDPATGDMYVLGGAGDPYGSVSYDVVINKFNSSGNLLWNRTWGTEYHDSGYGMVLRNNTLFIAGWTHDSYYTKGDMFFLKVDTTNGDILDEKWFYTVVHSSCGHSHLGYEEMRSRIAVDYDRGYIYVPIISGAFCQGCGVYPVSDTCPDGCEWAGVDEYYTDSPSFNSTIPPVEDEEMWHDGVVLVFNLTNMEYLGYHAWSDETHIYLDGATVDGTTGDLYMSGMLSYRTRPSSTHHGKIWRTPKGDELLSKNKLWSPETWTYEEGRYFRWDEGIIIDNYLYLLGNGPLLRKIDLSTMNITWTYHFTGWWYASGIITEGDYLYVGGSDGYQEEGDAVIAKISKDGEFLGQWKIGKEGGNDGIEDVAMRSDGSLTGAGHVAELNEGGCDYCDAMLWFVQGNITPSGCMIINNDTEYTTSRDVTLTLLAEDAESGIIEMRFANDKTEEDSWSDWLPYGITCNWTLSDGYGEKKVYVQYKNSAGLESLAYYDMIQYVATEPAPNATPTLTPTPTPKTASNVPRGGSGRGSADTTGGEYLTYPTPTVTPLATSTSVDEKRKPIPTSTIVPSETPATIHSTPTSTPTLSTQKSPDFKAVYAFIVLIAVAYLVLKRRSVEHKK